MSKSEELSDEKLNQLVANGTAALNTIEELEALFDERAVTNLRLTIGTYVNVLVSEKQSRERVAAKRRRLEDGVVLLLNQIEGWNTDDDTLLLARRVIDFVQRDGAER